MPQVGIISWDARGLWHWNDIKRREKIDYLKGLSKRYDVVCIQESHIEPEYMEHIEFETIFSEFKFLNVYLVTNYLQQLELL